MKNLEVMLKISMTLENQNVCKLKTNWSEPEPNNELWTNKMIVHNFQRHSEKITFCSPESKTNRKYNFELLLIIISSIKWSQEKLVGIPSVGI